MNNQTVKWNGTLVRTSDIPVLEGLAGSFSKSEAIHLVCTAYSAGIRPPALLARNAGGIICTMLRARPLNEKNIGALRLLEHKATLELRSQGGE